MLIWGVKEANYLAVGAIITIDFHQERAGFALWVHPRRMTSTVIGKSGTFSSGHWLIGKRYLGKS